MAEAARPSGDAEAATLSEAGDEASEPEAPKDDYRSALAALEQREAEELRLAEEERRRVEEERARVEEERLRAEEEAKVARRQAERDAELARQRAQREAERVQAEAVAARRAERESWMKLGTTIANGIVAIAAAKRGYTDPSQLPSIQSLSGSGLNSGLGTGSGSSSSSWVPRIEQTPSLPSFSTSTPSAGSGAGSPSSDCQDDVTPMCRQVASTIESRTAGCQCRSCRTFGRRCSRCFSIMPRPASPPRRVPTAGQRTRAISKITARRTNPRGRTRGSTVAGNDRSRLAALRPPRAEMSALRPRALEPSPSSTPGRSRPRNVGDAD